MYKENMRGGTRLVSLIHFHVPATTTKTTITYVINSHRAHAHKMTQRKTLLPPGRLNIQPIGNTLKTTSTSFG